MEKSKIKVNLLFFSIAIMLTKFASMGDFAIYPITNEFYNLFPSSEGIVNYIISGPQLLIMVMAFAVPLLAKRMTKKTMIVLSTVIFAVGSVFSVIIADPLVMAAGRTLVGIGQGVLGIVSVTIVADVITDQNKQARLIGIYNASGNMAAMILSIAAGALAAYSWKHPFLLYFVSVPMLIAVVLFIPDIKIEEKAETEEKAKKEKISLNTEFWVMAIAAAVFSMLRTVIMYYMSSYVAENALGNTSVAATAASMAQLFAFIGAMSFALVYSKIERWIMPIACGIITVALILWCTTFTPVTVFVVYCLACGSSGLFMAYIYAHAMAIVEKRMLDTAIALLSAVCGVAAFIPTYFVTFVMKLLNSSTVTPTLWVNAAIGAVLFAVTLFYTVSLKRKLNRKPLTEQSAEL